MPAALIAILCVASLVLAGLAVAQNRRRRRLANSAHRLGLNFSAEDMFGLPQRFAAFTLMQAGHSAYADNVLYGRVSGWFLRAFDYRYEAGHGPHRLIRRYTVVAAEPGEPMLPALAWSSDEARPDAPPAIDARLWAESWHVAGASNEAVRLASAWPEPPASGICIEARDGLMLFSRPGRLSSAQLMEFVRQTSQCLDRLQLPVSADRSQDQKPPADD